MLARSLNSDNYGLPYEFVKGDTKLNCRLVDVVNFADTTVTDNHSLVSVAGKIHSVLPEFWGQWRFHPVYIDRPATHTYTTVLCHANEAIEIEFLNY